MKSIAAFIGRIPATLQALMALGAAAAGGAVVNNVLQTYRGVPAQIEENQAQQAERDSVQDYAIDTHMLEYRRLNTQVEDLQGLERLPEIVEELALQLCLDRADRAGSLTQEAMLECNRDSQRMGSDGG